MIFAGPFHDVAGMATAGGQVVMVVCPASRGVASYGLRRKLIGEY